MKKIGLIIAYDQQGTIGTGTNLPNWRLKDDMDHFVETTIGNAVIMGRKNWESIPPKFRPLRNRTNIVMTRNSQWHDDGCITSTSLWDALVQAEQTPGNVIFIIGGAEIYKLALEKLVIDEIYLTKVDGTFEGTVKFPTYDLRINNYRLERSKDFKKNERNSHDFTILKYVK